MRNRDDGCKCDLCGRNYKVDLLIPDSLWLELYPDKNKAENGGGMLCAECIIKMIENKNIFMAFELKEIP